MLLPYIRRLGPTVAACFLAACTFNTTTSQSDPHLNAEAQANFADLVAGRDDAILARLPPETPVEAARAQMPVLRQLVGDAPVPEPTVTRTQSVNSTEGKFYSVGQEYAYPDRVAYVETHFAKEHEAWKIEAFNVNVRMTAAAEPAPAS
jgi:hypothetical protein